MASKSKDVEVIVKEKAPEPKFDSSKIPEKISNVYREFTPDGKEFIWGSDNKGNEFGRQEYKVVEEETGEVVESGYKYTIPYDAKVVATLKKNMMLGGSFYHKTGGPTRLVAPDNF